MRDDWHDSIEYEMRMQALAASHLDIRDGLVARADEGITRCVALRDRLSDRLDTLCKLSKVGSIAHRVVAPQLRIVTCRELQRAFLLRATIAALPDAHDRAEEYLGSAATFQRLASDVMAVLSQFVARVDALIGWIGTAGLTLMLWLWKSTKEAAEKTRSIWHVLPPYRCCYQEVPQALQPPSRFLFTPTLPRSPPMIRLTHCA